MKKILSKLFSKKRDWELVSKTYAPPRRDLVGQGYPAGVLLGVTTLVWECKITGDIRSREFIGSDEQQLDNLFQKVKDSGTQHIKDKDGEVYSLAKWVLPVENVLDLPMR